MKNSTKILIFFLAIFLLFWNPISFYLFYSANVIYQSSALRQLFWILSFSSILLIVVLVIKNDFLNKFQNLIFGLSFIGILFGILILINSLLGSLIKQKKESLSYNTNLKRGLIFKPNSIAHYTTVEYDFVAEINSLGLRNKEISIIKKEGTYRILCLGDSYTYGWGVNIEYSWPMQLEKFLQQQGYSNIEVINCGQPGQYSSTFKKYMSEIVPLLTPNLVLVSVLQTDDLAQLFENNFIFKKDITKSSSKFTKDLISATKYLVKALLKASFENYIKVFNNIKKKDEINVTNTWKEVSISQIQSFDKVQKMRFYTLPDTIQTLFKTGNLNPGLLYHYINFPERAVIFNNPLHPATVFALDEMDKDFQEMKQICRTNDTEMIFINMPNEYYTGYKEGTTPSNMLGSYLMSNNKVDSLYKSIAVKNQIRYLQLTERFIELNDSNSLFFLYDDHPNEKGYMEIAIVIGEYLVNNLIIK